MKYFKVGRKYDEYRLLKVYQSPHHCEVILQAHPEYFENERWNNAIKTATMIAKALGIVELQKISEPHYEETGKMRIVFDENNYVSEEPEVLVYYVYYFKRRIRAKRRGKGSGKR